MEEIKVKGIVVKSIDYQDSDKIVTIFSPEFGMINARARGVKKAKAKLAFAVQPFAFVEFLLIQKGDFFTVVNATSIDQFFEITNDFDNYIFMMACMEVCQKTIKQNDVHSDLFLLLLSSFKAVCYDKVSAMVVFVKFMLEAMKMLGYALEFENCACCGNDLSLKEFNFSFDYNGLICPKCTNKNDSLALSLGEFAILSKIDENSMNNLSGLKFLSRADMVSVISLMCKDFRIMTEEEIVTIKQYLWWLSMIFIIKICYIFH